MLALIARAYARLARGRVISRARALELFCPKDFHYYEGFDVCLLFCRKKVCRVFKMLKRKKREG